MGFLSLEFLRFFWFFGTSDCGVSCEFRRRKRSETKKSLGLHMQTMENMLFMRYSIQQRNRGPEKRGSPLKNASVKLGDLFLSLVYDHDIVFRNRPFSQYLRCLASFLQDHVHHLISDIALDHDLFLASCVL